MIEALQRILDHWMELVAITVAFLVLVKSKNYYH